MGRRKIVRERASDVSLEYVKTAIRNYEKMRKACEDIEIYNPSLLQKGGINLLAFDPKLTPSEETFITPKVYDQGKMDRYLEEKEKIYLLESGIHNLENRYRKIAHTLFIEGASWQETMETYCVSKMTLCRIRKEAINQIALFVDQYMFWKVQSLFG